MNLPNFHGMILQNGDLNVNLLALPMVPMINPNTCKIEEIWPEYSDTGYYKSDGTIAANTTYSNAEIDVSKYKYVFIPVITISNVTCVSGLRAASGTGSLTKHLDQRPGTTTVLSSYGAFEVGATPYACVSCLADLKLPVIGVIEA